MLIRLSDALLINDLCADFQRAGFTAGWAGGSMIEVNRPDRPDEAQERRDIELHLRVWRAVHPEVTADIVD